MNVARRLVEALYTLPAGLLLRSYRGDFYFWDGTHYLELDRRDVRTGRVVLSLDAKEGQSP